MKLVTCAEDALLLNEVLEIIDNYISEAEKVFKNNLNLNEYEIEKSMYLLKGFATNLSNIYKNLAKQQSNVIFDISKQVDNLIDDENETYKIDENDNTLLS